MKLVALLTAAVFSSLILTTHAAAPRPSGYLSDYDRLVEGEYLEAYWVDIVATRRSKNPHILLGTISADKVSDHNDVTVAETINWLKNDLLAGAVIVDQTDGGYRLDVAITHLDPGSAAKRILAGEFGAGHAQLQIEGKVIDRQSDRVVASFAERRRSSGAIGVQDLAGDAGPHIIEHLINLISADISSELTASFRSQ